MHRRSVESACDQLRMLLDEERVLRGAAKRSLVAGEPPGYSRKAHEELMEEIVQACRTLLEKAGS